MTQEKETGVRKREEKRYDDSGRYLGIDY